MGDVIANSFRRLRVFLFGKGILTLATFVALAVGAAFGSTLVPALVVSVGGAVVSAASRLYQNRLYQDDMVDLYRDNIAQQLGIAPAEVTRSHLRDAAQENDVIAQALIRQRKKTIVSVGTSILSAVVSLGLIQAFNVQDMLKGLADESFKGWLKPLASFIGVGTVAGLSNLILHQGLDAAIGYKTGINRAAAHDLILEMHLSVGKGKAISREQVFAVVVAANPSLDATIVKRFGESYASMSRGEQGRVLSQLGLAERMDGVASAINAGKLRPGYLAFAANDQRLLTPVGSSAPARATTERSPNLTRSADTPGFVERLGLSARDGGMSQTERLAASRSGEYAALATPTR